MALINKRLLEKLSTCKTEDSVIARVQLIELVPDTGVYDSFTIQTFSHSIQEE